MEGENPRAVMHRVSNVPGQYLFYCPACKCAHHIMTGSGDGPRWEFDGNVECPTVSPSIRVRGTEPITDDEHRRIMGGEKITPRDVCCHFFIKAGGIEYCGDCTHGMSGQRVEMKPL